MVDAMSEGYKTRPPQNQSVSPMNLTIDTSRAASTVPAATLPLPTRGNRFPLSSPITDEHSSPEESDSASSSRPREAEPKLVNTNLSAAGHTLNLHANSALSKGEVERALCELLRNQESKSRLSSRRDMISAASGGVDGVLKMQNKRKSGIIKRSHQQQQQQQQQRPSGLQVLTDFDAGHASDRRKETSFLDLNDLKSIAKKRSGNRLAEADAKEILSTMNTKPVVTSRAAELSPSDGPITIGLTVPYDEATTQPTATNSSKGDTLNSASLRTPVTPTITLTPARENHPWHIDTHMDMSTSPEMLHRPRATSSNHSQSSSEFMYDEDVPPVPVIPASHVGRISQQDKDNHLHMQNHRPISMGTVFEEDQDMSREKQAAAAAAAGSSSTEDAQSQSGKRNVREKILHKLSVNTSDANRPESQGWWTYLLSPLLSRSNTASSRRPTQHLQQPRSARSPLAQLSFRAISPPQPISGTDDESSAHWWDDEKRTVPAERSHFSPDTPEETTRHVPLVRGANGAGIIWDMPFSDNHVVISRTPRNQASGVDDEEAKNEKTRSVGPDPGYATIQTQEVHGAAAEYYQACAHDLSNWDNPYFECVNHVCSMTSPKRRAEVEAREKAMAEQASASAAAATAMDLENEKGGLAVFVFDPSRDPQNPFIAFIEKGVVVTDVKEIGDAEIDSERERNNDDNDVEEKEELGDGAKKEGLEIGTSRNLLPLDSDDDEDVKSAAGVKAQPVARSVDGFGGSSPVQSTAASSFKAHPERSGLISLSVDKPREVDHSPPPAPPPAVTSHARQMSPPPAPAPPAPAPPPPGPAAPPMSYILPPVAPAPVPPPMSYAYPPMAPAPVPMAPATMPVSVPQPPPQPRAFSPESTPMPMPPPPSSAPESRETSMPKAMLPSTLTLPPPESSSIPFGFQSQLVNDRNATTMPTDPRLPSSGGASASRGLPSGYEWDAHRSYNTNSPARSLTSQPSARQLAPYAGSRFQELDDAVNDSQRNATIPSGPRRAPSFAQQSPVLVTTRPLTSPQTQSSALNDITAHNTDAESELPPYTASALNGSVSGHGHHFQSGSLPRYSTRSFSRPESRDASESASPGPQRPILSRGGIQMAHIAQERELRDANVNRDQAGSNEPSTVRNHQSYFNGEHPRDAPMPPRPGNQFVVPEALGTRDENEARRQRGEKEDRFFRKIGGLWRGRGCISAKGCFGRGGRENRVRRRWYAAIIAFCIIVIALSISLATTLTHRGDSTPVNSQWVNITGYPPIPTGIMTVAGPAPAVERSSCIAPAQAWSCALPPEQQASNAGGYAADLPNFRIEIQFRNDSSLLSNNTSNASNSTNIARSIASILSRRDSWNPSPAAPRLADQIFLGNTTDNITTPFQGEDTPFYITFLLPVDVSNITTGHSKRDVFLSNTGTATGIATGTATTATAASTGTDASNTGTMPSTTQTGTSAATSTSASDFNLNSIIPPPNIASDGTAAAATLYPLPIQQPVKLYNRGLSTEHYGFFTYFDKSIFLASNATITGGTNDTDPRDANGGSAESQASVRCTWSQTRFLVQIWTQPQNATHMMLTASSNSTLNSTSSSNASSAVSSSSSSSSSVSDSSANNFTSPGSFPYPITITIDRHGGLATKKLAYCYGVEHQTSQTSGGGGSNSVTGTYYNLTDPKLQAEQRSSGGTIVSPSPDYFILASAISQGAQPDQIPPVDGGTGGCMCQWRNWIEVH